ncbi:MAG TPA: phospholipid carrier-dependent glycosyltransferase, partial [Actinomycetota bacterium]|nr:phospholipid carrier-dependent glycosyltransferase [Actinomycetota bacterium]
MTSDVEIIHPEPASFRRAGDALVRFANTALAGWRLPALITLAAALVRFVRLNHPPTIVPLDETYYAPNSYGFLCHGVDMTFADTTAPATCDKLEPTFVVHPPVAKLLMAAAIRIFGYNAFGWRAAPALVGSLSVLAMYLIGRRLWSSRWLAAGAAVLLGVEGLQFVQSRLAMLDIFQSFFMLLSIWLLLEDRARAPSWTGLRWWRLGAGAALGLAVASKWAAAPLLPVVFGVGLAWEAVRIQQLRSRPAAPLDPTTEPEAGPEPVTPRPRRDRLWWQAAALLLTFAVLPLIIYLASYTSWFLSTKRYIPPRCNDVVTVDGEQRSIPKAGMSLWVCDQKEIFDYHRNLRSTDADGKPIHPYMSKAWSWPWISRPAAHYYTATCVPDGGAQPCADGQIAQNEEILGLPNPVIWWTGFFIALPLSIWWMIVARDDVSALLVVLFLPLVLPWFLTTRPLFMFYMTPATPLLVLMIVHVMKVWNLRATAV